MGTHPIFESDFDCLTENWQRYMQKLFYVGIGIFLCILFVTTKYGLGMTQNDLILEEDSKKYLKNQIAEADLEKLQFDCEKIKNLDEKIKSQEIKLENLNSEILSAQSRLDEKLELLKTTQLEIDALKQGKNPEAKSDIEIMKEKS